MRGCLFTLLLGAVAIVLIVVVGLPAVAASVLTSAVTGAGLQAADTTVTVSSDPPTDLIGLHADEVRVQATDATFKSLAIGGLDMKLHDVSIVDRTAGAVDGRLTKVVVPDIGGQPLTLAAITLGGDGDAITAVTTVPGAVAERLVADAIEARAGIRPTVTLSAPDRLTVNVGVSVGGRLDTNAAGDLVVVIGDNPLVTGEIVLLRGSQDLPIRLTSVAVTVAGDLELSGDLAIRILG